MVSNRAISNIVSMLRRFTRATDHRGKNPGLSANFSKIIALLLLAGALLLLGGCNADPNATDVQRVKETFLQLRFQSGIQPELKGKNDLELFNMACRHSHVKCNEVLKNLQSSDPDFFNTLEDSAKD